MAGDNKGKYISGNGEKYEVHVIKFTTACMTPKGAGERAPASGRNPIQDVLERKMEVSVESEQLEGRLCTSVAHFRVVIRGDMNRINTALD